MKEASSDAKDSGQGVLEEVSPPVGHKGEEERWMIQEKERFQIAPQAIKLTKCALGTFCLRRV